MGGAAVSDNTTALLMLVAFMLFLGWVLRGEKR